MATARSSKTLESVTKRFALNGLTLVETEMKFGLADNEIAQMCMVDMEYETTNGDVTDCDTGLALSLDPDSNLEPLTDDLEDSEYLCGMQTNGKDIDMHGNVGKTLVFDDKMNFGTNIGLTGITNHANVHGIYIVTVWFLRKKASSIELAKILLKRR